MESPRQPRIRSADRLGDKLLVLFDDGKFGIFSAQFLREALSGDELVDEAEFLARFEEG